MEYTIEAFVEKLLKEKGMTGLSPEVMAQLKSDLADRAETLINAEIVANLPKDKLSEFDALLESGGEEEVQDFCQKNIPNLAEVTAGALLKLQKAYLGGVKS